MVAERGDGYGLISCERVNELWAYDDWGSMFLAGFLFCLNRAPVGDGRVLNT